MSLMGAPLILEQTVTITATVRFNLVQRHETSSAITLVTNSESVSFFVTDRTDRESLRDYQEDQQYTFTLFIIQIDPPDEDYDTYAIWSNETD